MDNKEIALFCAKVLDEKKAEDIIVLDIAEKSGFADYFVICSASNLRLVSSLSDELEDKLALEGIFAKNIEGRGESGWVLLDYGDIVVSIFTSAQRDKYQIERVWNDCIKIDW